MSEKRLKKENIETGQRVKSVRICKGMTQEQFADKIGISPSALKKIESGENGVSTKVLRSLIGMNVSSDYILDGKRESFDKLLFEIENSTEEEKMELFLKLFLEYTKGGSGEKMSEAQLTKLISSFLSKES